MKENLDLWRSKPEGPDEGRLVTITVDPHSKETREAYRDGSKPLTKDEREAVMARFTAHELA